MLVNQENTHQLVDGLIKNLSEEEIEIAKNASCIGPMAPYCGGPLRMIAYDDMPAKEV